MVSGIWTRYKLWLVRRLLWRADAVICSLPLPKSAAELNEPYGVLRGDLGSVHRAIDRAYGGPR
jgi:hypothetical protein